MSCSTNNCGGAEAASSAKVVQLRRVRSQVADQDLIRCLRTLLADAEAGKLIGMSYAVMATNREFFYSSAGEAHRSPAWAAALSATLMHGTMKRMFGDDG